MKKTIGMYSIIWGICLALFNVVVFLIPEGFAGINRFDGAFWIAYVFVTVAFIGQYICAVIALRGDATRLFYNIPLIAVSYVGLAAMLIVGTTFMKIPLLPDWLAGIVCFAVLAVNVIAVIKATTVAQIVTHIDQTVKTKMFFIKSLIIDAEAVLAGTSTPETKAIVERVLSEIRYSDPMSQEALADTESQISIKFAEFSNAVAENNVLLMEKNANELIILIKNRNSKCKLLK